ncbi:DNA mismatch repair endonuclease MutL [Idiomarina xiamenensis]|uniref:DNA mismatch repair protein MutL n=1 Tax=Idiomarina xiamenensis 10-D-4 TaxID=740709 RepID=K2JDS1_9GAMM|nr:DNA mismatch repair endonuclease MutL [Idiomarina xiamenensis]EKE81546.1 DNA mismatch repair enzyme, ATPase [Idiomarina xiamenensis 10-D-4]
MMIQLLPTELANQIAAGEVVERPASVVKELLENSLDAGATELQIDIEQGGAKRIRIRDNGAGIARDELTLALSRHATSKIKSLDDLEAILSLGFRGEALASISSVSRLRLTSKPAQQAEAWQAWTEGRDMQVQIEPAAHPDGTTIDVQDLFFNTPARRKFLRTEKTEFNHIDDVIKRIGLARFDIGLTLRHNHKVIRQFRAAGSEQQQLQRVAQICGKNFASEACRLTLTSGDYQLDGWVAAPQHCRHQADVQYFYVNGRMLRDRLILHALRQAYGEWLGDERSATFVLYLTLPAADVDVNVHPAKHEVRFQQSRQVHDFIYQAVRQALQQSLPTPAQEPVANVAAHQYQTQPSSEAGELRVAGRSPLPAAFTGSGSGTGSGSKPSYSQTPQRPLGQADWTALADAGPSSATPKHHHADANASAPATSTADWRPLSVLNGCWLLLQQQLPSASRLACLDLVSVAQHCQRRQLQQQITQTGLSGQPLLLPVTLRDSAVSQALAAVDGKLLARLGVLCQQRAEQVTVQQMPAMLRQGDVTALLWQLLQYLQGVSTVPDTLLDWLAERATPAQFRQTQAEHWCEYWQQQLQADTEYLVELALPAVMEQNHASD